FPLEVVWFDLVPTKIVGFLWQVFHKSISTYENLQKRGFIGPSCCVLCKADLESVSHLLVSCPFSSQVWTILSSKLAIWGPLHSDVSYFLRDWQTRNCKGEFHKFKEVLVHAVWWCLWGGGGGGGRNDRIFRDRSRSREQLIWRIFSLVGRWVRVADRISQEELRNWMSLWHHDFDPG
ncbi:hypothetical protein LINPERHAP2_LOCUS34742, partial [Linum perenne]